jgi:hypothetical protein
MEDFAVFEIYQDGQKSKIRPSQEIALAKRLSIPTQLTLERPHIAGFRAIYANNLSFTSIFRLRA